jgi:hypothetical protein
MNFFTNAAWCTQNVSIRPHSVYITQYEPFSNLLGLRGVPLFLGHPMFLSPVTMNLYTNLSNARIVCVSFDVTFINHNTWFSFVICSKITQLPAYLACFFRVDFQ